MKQYAIVIYTFLTLLVLSCKPETEEILIQENSEFSLRPPQIVLVDTANTITTDTVLVNATQASFSIAGYPNDSTGAKLAQFEIFQRVSASGSFQKVFDTPINDSIFGPFPYSIEAPNRKTIYTLIFRIHDVDGQIIDRTLSLFFEVEDLDGKRPENGVASFGGFPEPEFLAQGEGVWMAGDLHVHSDYSNDASNRPMQELIATAKSNDLNFLVVTDHDNHVNGDIPGNTWADPNYVSDDEITLLYGSEWTSAKGHAGTFAAEPFDYAKIYERRDGTIADLQQAIYDLDILFSANHPATSDPWGYGYDVVRSIEVWQSAIWENGTNPATQAIWNDQLNTGRRMTGIGGSDSHHGYATSFEDLFNPNSYQAFANAMGTPTTWVRAKDRSPESVLEAIIAGRVSISATPNAPRLVVKASDREDGTFNYGMGDNIILNQEQPITIEVSLENVQTPQLFPFLVTVIKNGGDFLTEAILPGQSAITFQDTPEPGSRSYYRVILQGLAEPQSNSPVSPLLGTGMVALSNPVYINF